MTKRAKAKTSKKPAAITKITKKSQTNKRKPLKFKQLHIPGIPLPASPGDLPLDERINALFNLKQVKIAISSQYQTVYKYCAAFQITEAEMSRFLNKKCPITLKMLMKHCDNLGLHINTISLTKG